MEIRLGNSLRMWNSECETHIWDYTLNGELIHNWELIQNGNSHLRRHKREIRILNSELRTHTELGIHNPCETHSDWEIHCELGNENWELKIGYSELETPHLVLRMLNSLTF